MRKRDYPAGTTLVKKGDDADRLFYLAEGEFEIVEIGKVLQAGALVGEIGVFAPNQKRTATILCRTDCRVFELSESTAKQLYFQDRAFGFAIMRLIIARLTEYNDIRAQPAGAA
jgi:CRP-like cAMP-binding protein